MSQTVITGRTHREGEKRKRKKNNQQQKEKKKKKERKKEKNKTNGGAEKSYGICMVCNNKART